MFLFEALKAIGNSPFLVAYCTDRNYYVHFDEFDNLRVFDKKRRPLNFYIQRQDNFILINRRDLGWPDLR